MHRQIIFFIFWQNNISCLPGCLFIKMCETVNGFWVYLKEGFKLSM